MCSAKAVFFPGLAILDSLKSKPPKPPTPPEPDVVDDSEKKKLAKQKADKAKKKQLANVGLQQSILTGPLGLGTPSGLSAKTLIGQ